MKYRLYRIVWTDENGLRRSEMAFSDRAASEALLRRKEIEVERRKAGLPVVEEQHRRKPIAEVIAAFLAELVSRGSEPDGPHVKEARRILATVFQSCGWRTLADVRRDRFSEYLADLAQQGKAPNTRKQHLAFLRNFLNWCTEQRWIEENPIRDLKSPTVGQAGKKRRRRAYTDDEIRRLLANTPEPRRTIYFIALASGYRRKELTRIEKQDLTPIGEKPRWHVRATISKNRRLDVVPMVPDLAPVLAAAWEKLPTATSKLVKDGLAVSVPRHETLHRDLERAGIARIDELGRHADFHSFRYTFCRLMGERLPIQKVKVLMRHSTIKLTADLYCELGMEDVAENVWSLPPLNVSVEPQGHADGEHRQHGQEITPRIDEQQNDYDRTQDVRDDQRPEGNTTRSHSRTQPKRKRPEGQGGEKRNPM